MTYVPLRVDIWDEDGEVLLAADQPIDVLYDTFWETANITRTRHELEVNGETDAYWRPDPDPECPSQVVILRPVKQHDHFA